MNRRQQFVPSLRETLEHRVVLSATPAGSSGGEVKGCSRNG
jgi:hypothetical protein